MKESEFKKWVKEKSKKNVWKHEPHNNSDTIPTIHHWSENYDM